MRDFLFLVSYFSLLVSCQNNSNQIPVVGSIDYAAIAIDTLMQKGFESSYEFHKTLTVHEKLVYDVVGYGGSSSQGEFSIIKRGADNKADTVVKGTRDGFIVDAIATDAAYSEKKISKRIYLITQRAGIDSLQNILGYYLDVKKQDVKLNAELPEAAAFLSKYKGHDKYYFEKEKLIREFPLYDNKGGKEGKMKITYSLAYVDLLLEKIEQLK